MKRNLPAEFSKEENSKFSRKNDDPQSQLDLPDRNAIQEINEIQVELQKIDEECASEQMLIQKKFDETKKPWFEKRQKVIDKIPGFWCQTLEHHPALSFITSEDLAILAHLKRIDLDDNMDKNGSYKISFTFDEAASEFLEPLTISKLVVFKSEKEVAVNCTEIKWKPGKNPIENVRSKNLYNAREWNYSLFEWFLKDNGDRDDLGEALRRDIWHSPVVYYLGEIIGDEVDDDYDDEADFEDDDDEEGEEDAEEDAEDGEMDDVGNADNEE